MKPLQNCYFSPPSLLQKKTFLLRFSFHKSIRVCPEFPYCGAGEGLGDFLVPDTIEGAYINPACFVHDLDWAVADGSMEAFHAANERFRLNLKELVSAQILDDGDLVRAFSWCNIYFAVVDSKVGEENYQPTGQNPFTNPVVKQKLQRLAYVVGGIPIPTAG